MPIEVPNLFANSRAVFSSPVSPADGGSAFQAAEKTINGDWLVQCNELMLNALWHKRREDAIYYARLLGKENNGEICIFRDGSTTESVIAV